MSRIGSTPGIHPSEVSPIVEPGASLDVPVPPDVPLYETRTFVLRFVCNSVRLPERRGTCPRDFPLSPVRHVTDCSLAFRDLSFSDCPCSLVGRLFHCQSGVVPLLGFQLSRVFPSPVSALPMQSLLSCTFRLDSWIRWFRCSSDFSSESSSPFGARNPRGGTSECQRPGELAFLFRECRPS